jgi:hypothetical protein
MRLLLIIIMILPVSVWAQSSSVNLDQAMQTIRWKWGI